MREQHVDRRALKETIAAGHSGRGGTNNYAIDLDAGTLKPPFTGGKANKVAMSRPEKGDRVAPFPEEKGDRVAPFPEEKGDIAVSLFFAKRVTSTTEKGDKNSRKGDIALAPDPLTVKEPPLSEEEEEVDWDLLERLGLGGKA